MKEKARDNYIRFMHLLDQEEKEIIHVLCPWCYKETPFDLMSINNHCNHCSININQELIYVYTEAK